MRDLAITLGLYFVLLATPLAVGATPPWAVSIYRGPGSDNCGPSPSSVHLTPPSFAQSGPGIYSLVGTSITIEWRPGDNDYLVHWTNYTHTFGEWGAAAADALEWAGQLRAHGYAP